MKSTVRGGLNIEFGLIFHYRSSSLAHCQYPMRQLTVIVIDMPPAEWLSYGFRVALPPLGRAGPAWDAGLLFIVKVQLLLILNRLLPHWHQVIIQLTWKESK